MASIADIGSSRPSIAHRVVSAISDAFDSLARARAAAAQVEYLYDLSDAQLAARGLDRDAIPGHILDKYLDIR